MLRIILLILMIGCHYFGYSQQGILDSTFGNSGIYFHDLTNGYEGGNYAEFQADGKLLLANQISQLNTDFGLSRHNSDGSLDLSFGNAGFTRVSTPTMDYAQDVGFNMVNQRIYLSGISSDLVNYSNFKLARFFDNGVLDSSFGQAGVISYDFGNFEFLSEMKVLNNGKILIAGYSNITFPTGVSNILVLKVNEDGSIDSSFANNGLFREPMYNYDGKASGLEVLANGELLVSGYALDSSDWEFYLGVLKLDSNGARVSGFGQNSRVRVVPFDGSRLTGERMAVSGNKIYVAGGKSFVGANEEKGTVSCIDLQSGQLISSFGMNGTVYFKTLSQGPTEFYKVLVQNDGKVLAYGRMLESNGDQLLISRFDSNGYLDSLDFGTGGYTLVNISSGYDHYADLLFGANNSIWVTGGGNTPSAGFQTIIVRFNNSLGVGLKDQHFDDVSGFVYPNPASDLLTIRDFNESYSSFSIFNSFGKEFKLEYRQEGEVLVVNTSELSPGLYIFRISDGKRQYSEKVLIER